MFARSNWDTDAWRIAVTLPDGPYTSVEEPSMSWRHESLLSDEDASARGLLNLDPIKCAGSIALDEPLRVARGIGSDWGCLAVQVISDDEVFLEFAAPVAGEKGYLDGPDLQEPTIRTLARYWNHCDQLASMGVVRKHRFPPTIFHELKGSVRYFPTPKDLLLSRAIMDTEHLTRWGQRPPPFSLVQAPYMIELVRTLVGPGHPVYMFCGDQRHYFYQLPITSKELRKWLWILCEGTWFNIRMLPMGWRWAPWIAQSIFWMLIVRVPEGEDSLGINLADFRGLSPPPFVWLHDRAGKRVGIIVVYYDGCFVVSTDRALADAWRERLKVNAESFRGQRSHQKGAIWKYLTNVGKIASFNGVEFVQDESGRLMWRSDPKTVQSWASDLARTTISSRVQIACLASYAVRQCTIKFLPLARAAQILGLLRAESRAVGQSQRIKRAWLEAPGNGELHDAALAEVRLLCSNADEYTTKPWFVSHKVVASDASTHGGAFIMVDDMVRLLASVTSYRWRLTPPQIYLAELCMACMVCTAAIRPGVRVVAAIDNAAARINLGRGYAANPKALKMISAVWAFAESQGAEVVTWITNHEDNPADEPTQSPPARVNWLKLRALVADVERFYHLS